MTIRQKTASKAETGWGKTGFFGEEEAKIARSMAFFAEVSGRMESIALFRVPGFIVYHLPVQALKEDVPGEEAPGR